jgi:2Fe-2S ferredoxin
MPKVTFVHPDGSRETHEVARDRTVMDCALDNNVRGIKAQCGGGCTCSTCHCYVLLPWLAKLPPPIGDETDMLEYVWRPRPQSRLSCQIRVTDDLDGIVVEIPERQAIGDDRDLPDD